jgi:predicted small lipoprotein YifL
MPCYHFSLFRQSSAMPRYRQLICIISALLTLSACGTKGPLYLPKKNPPPVKPAAQAPAVDDSTAPEPTR